MHSHKFFADDFKQEDAVMSHPTQTPKCRRFKLLTEQELAFKKPDFATKNTLNAEKCADKAFRQFLLESGCESDEYTLFTE